MNMCHQYLTYSFVFYKKGTTDLHTHTHALADLYTHTHTRFVLLSVIVHDDLTGSHVSVLHVKKSSCDGCEGVP